MTAKISGTNGLLQSYDYQASTTGFSYTFAAGTTVLVMNPAGTLATGTITMPAAPSDGMTITFSSSQAITALTVNANTGQSIVGAPTALLAGGSAIIIYRLSNTTWYTQINTYQAPVTPGATGVPVLNVYTSPGTYDATTAKAAGLKAIKVTVVGSGAGGGVGNNNPSYQVSGGGGGGGGSSIRIYPAPSLPGPQPYTVGAGAAAGAGGNSSSFGVAPVTVISATGGSVGGTAPSFLIGGAGGAGGAGSGGTLNANGGGGTGGPFSTATPGNPSTGAAGGSSMFGGGALGTNTLTAANGTAYGGGGGGATQSNGGTGFAGVVIVEEFY